MGRRRKELSNEEGRRERRFSVVEGKREEMFVRGGKEREALS